MRDCRKVWWWTRGGEPGSVRTSSLNRCTNARARAWSASGVVSRAARPLESKPAKASSRRPPRAAAAIPAAEVARGGATRSLRVSATYASMVRAALGEAVSGPCGLLSCMLRR